MTDEQCRLQTVKAQGAVGTGRLVGDLMSRARKSERKLVREGTDHCRSSRVTLRSTWQAVLSLLQDETRSGFGEGALICSLVNLELFCITGLYNLIFISSLMP